MPEDVLERLAYSGFGRKEVDELHKMMLAEPARFPEKAVKALERDSDTYDPTEVERERKRLANTPCLLNDCRVSGVQR